MTSFVTTEPAPILEFSPIVRLGSMVQFAPIEAPSLTTEGFSFHQATFEGGFLSFVKTV